MSSARAKKVGLVPPLAWLSLSIASPAVSLPHTQIGQRSNGCIIRSPAYHPLHFTISGADLVVLHAADLPKARGENGQTEARIKHKAFHSSTNLDVFLKEIRSWKRATLSCTYNCS